MGKCYLYALWIDTEPSWQHATNTFPVLSYFNDFRGLLN